MEQAWHREGLLQRAQKAWAYGTPPPLAILFKEVGEILKNVEVTCAEFRQAVLIVQLVLRLDLYIELL